MPDISFEEIASVYSNYLDQYRILYSHTNVILNYNASPIPMEVTPVEDDTSSEGPDIDSSMPDSDYDEAEPVY